MKKLSKKSLDELAQVMPVIREVQQKKFVGGTVYYSEEGFRLGQIGLSDAIFVIPQSSYSPDMTSETEGEPLQDSSGSAIAVLNTLVNLNMTQGLSNYSVEVTNDYIDDCPVFIRDDTYFFNFQPNFAVSETILMSGIANAPFVTFEEIQNHALTPSGSIGGDYSGSSRDDSAWNASWQLALDMISGYLVSHFLDESEKMCYAHEVYGIWEQMGLTGLEYDLYSAQKWCGCDV